MTGSTDVDLDNGVYPHKPIISPSVERLKPSSTDLLHLGTARNTQPIFSPDAQPLRPSALSDQLSLMTEKSQKSDPTVCPSAKRFKRSSLDKGHSQPGVLSNFVDSRSSLHSGSCNEAIVNKSCNKDGQYDSHGNEKIHSSNDNNRNNKNSLDFVGSNRSERQAGFLTAGERVKKGSEKRVRNTDQLHARDAWTSSDSGPSRTDSTRKVHSHQKTSNTENLVNTTVPDDESCDESDLSDDQVRPRRNMDCGTGQFRAGSSGMEKTAGNNDNHKLFGSSSSKQGSKTLPFGSGVKKPVKIVYVEPKDIVGKRTNKCEENSEKNIKPEACEDSKIHGRENADITIVRNISAEIETGKFSDSIKNKMGMLLDAIQQEQAIVEEDLVKKERKADSRTSRGDTELVKRPLFHYGKPSGFSTGERKKESTGQMSSYCKEIDGRTSSQFCSSKFSSTAKKEQEEKMLLEFNEKESKKSYVAPSATAYVERREQTAKVRNDCRGKEFSRRSYDQEGRSVFSGANNEEMSDKRYSKHTRTSLDGSQSRSFEIEKMKLENSWDKSKKLVLKNEDKTSFEKFETWLEKTGQQNKQKVEVDGNKDCGKRETHVNEKNEEFHSSKTKKVEIENMQRKRVVNERIDSYEKSNVESYKRRKYVYARESMDHSDEDMIELLSPTCAQEDRKLHKGSRERSNEKHGFISRENEMRFSDKMGYRGTEGTSTSLAFYRSRCHGNESQDNEASFEDSLILIGESTEKVSKFRKHSIREENEAKPQNDLVPSARKCSISSGTSQRTLTMSAKHTLVDCSDKDAKQNTWTEVSAPRTKVRRNDSLELPTPIGKERKVDKDDDRYGDMLESPEIIYKIPEKRQHIESQYTLTDVHKHAAMCSQDYLVEQNGADYIKAKHGHEENHGHRKDPYMFGDPSSSERKAVCTAGVGRRIAELATRKTTKRARKSLPFSDSL